MNEMMHNLETASILDKPCEICHTHAPRANVTQGHHRFPKFMQALIWGPIMEKTPKFPELVWLCPTIHMNLHWGLQHWFATGQFPKELSKNSYLLVLEAVTKFTENSGKRIPISPAPVEIAGRKV